MTRRIAIATLFVFAASIDVCVAADPRYPLYDPRDEHDACGTGFVADVAGRRSHRIVVCLVVAKRIRQVAQQPRPAIVRRENECVELRAPGAGCAAVGPGADQHDPA